MKKKLFLSLFCIILIFATVLCGASSSILSNNKVTPAPVATNAEATVPAETTVSPTYTIDSKDPFTLSEGSSKVISLTDSERQALLKWTSSDQNVVTVDSGGRVDALNKGTATVTASFSDNSKIECEVTVNDAEKSVYDGYSTCIIKNTDIEEKNKNSGNNANLYYIMVNRQENCVTVYTYDDNGEYTVPVRAMVCSCGTDYGTITGDFGIYFKNEWHPLFDNVYGHYVSGISGDYLFHSVPYYAPSNDQLEVEEFNKLGTSASLGCVRLATADVKWIYDNCPQDTPITIYDNDTAGPLGKPDTIKITDLACGWDPTDDNEANPYKNAKPIISGAVDCTIKKGGDFYPLGAISAVDTCGNDITDKVSVMGNVVTSKTGTYKVSYSVTDVMHRTATKTINVMITD